MPRGDSKGDYDKAIEYYEQALASDLKTFGPDHPKCGDIDRNNLGLAWDSKGDYDKAIEYYEQAFEIHNNVFGSNHPDTKFVSDNLNQAKKENDGARINEWPEPSVQFKF